MAPFQPVLATAPAGLPAGDRIGYGAVHLEVTDLDRSLVFWRDVIGLQPVDVPGDGVGLGTAGRPHIVLHPGAVRAAGRGHAGLYHVAIHLPDEVAFAEALARLIVVRMPQSPTDHIFSKATYLHDPDGITLELALETPERFRSLTVTRSDVVMVDAEGRRSGPTEALDVDAALAPLGDRDPMVPLPAGTFVGHVHLHVPDLGEAIAFYRDVVGFDEHAVLTPFGLADMRAGGAFPHRLAVNVWSGPGARQAPVGTAGMRHYELVLAGADAMAGLAARLASAAVEYDNRDGELRFADPAGNRVAARGLVLPSDG